MQMGDMHFKFETAHHHIGTITMSNEIDRKFYQAASDGSFGSRLMVRARDQIYEDFLATCQPSPSDMILDVGVSDVVNDGANLLERKYEFPENITAAGLGEAARFREAYPEVAYVRIAPHSPLPFERRQFDIAVSNAVLEHVGSEKAQRAFVFELLRVSRKIFITVPNRLFPVEHHTAIPFMHWFDGAFRLSCRLVGKEEWAQPENLILMSHRKLLAACPAGVAARSGYTGLNLGPFSSNLFLMISAAE